MGRLGATAAIASAAMGCSLLVDLSDLGKADASAGDGATDADGVEACGFPIGTIQANPCASNPDANTACLSLDGGIGCVASPASCIGIYSNCASAADCPGHVCCLSGSFEAGCPGSTLSVQGTSCQPSCNFGSFRICTKQSDCTPATCVPISFALDGSPITISGGVCL